MSNVYEEKCNGMQFFEVELVRELEHVKVLSNLLLLRKILIFIRILMKRLRKLYAIIFYLNFSELSIHYFVFNKLRLFLYKIFLREIL